jgi:hypothetical protein
MDDRGSSGTKTGTGAPTERTERRAGGADREAAFLFWAALPRKRRSYRAVAEQFEASPHSVERWAHDGGWKERLRSVEADAARKADEELGSRRAKQLVEFQGLIEASCIAYARQLANGDVRVTASDLVGLIRASLLLHGAPAARVEVISASNEWVELRGRILHALAEHPEASLALAEALDEAEEVE